jgi:hypothetical protein
MVYAEQICSVTHDHYFLARVLQILAQISRNGYGIGYFHGIAD